MTETLKSSFIQLARHVSGWGPICSYENAGYPVTEISATGMKIFPYDQTIFVPEETIRCTVQSRNCFVPSLEGAVKRFANHVA